MSAPYYYSDLISDPQTKPESRAYSDVFLTDYNDPFSAANLPVWLNFLGVKRETSVFRSKWAEHGYPFSTLDVVFGPTNLHYIHRDR
jgi:hypothetical protein